MAISPVPFSIERRYRLICSTAQPYLTSIAACSRDCATSAYCGCHGVGGLRLLYLGVGNVGLHAGSVLLHVQLTFGGNLRHGVLVADAFQIGFVLHLLLLQLLLQRASTNGIGQARALARFDLSFISCTALSIVPSSCRPALNPPTPNFSISSDSTPSSATLARPWCTSPEMQKWRPRNSERPCFSASSSMAAIEIAANFQSRMPSAPCCFNSWRAGSTKGLIFWRELIHCRASSQRFQAGNGGTQSRHNAQQFSSERYNRVLTVTYFQRAKVALHLLGFGGLAGQMRPG